METRKFTKAMLSNSKVIFELARMKKLDRINDALEEHKGNIATDLNLIKAENYILMRIGYSQSLRLRDYRMNQDLDWMEAGVCYEY